VRDVWLVGRMGSVTCLGNVGRECGAGAEGSVE
jgi:hypothetical protein